MREKNCYKTKKWQKVKKRRSGDSSKFVNVKLKFTYTW